MKFNQKKFVKRFVMYNKNAENPLENSTNEFNFFPAFVSGGNSIDWRNETKGEIEDIKREVQWREYGGIESIECGGGGCEDVDHVDSKSETKKLFRKSKKTEKETEAVKNEMWTFGERLRESSDGILDPELTENEKTVWKISKMSLPAMLPEKSTSNFSLNNQNMLWRSLEHIQQLYEDGYVQKVSEIINLEFENDFNEEMASEFLGTIGKSNGGATVRKARLSRWNFLRYDTGNETAKNRKEESPLKAKSYSKYFFVRRKSYDKSKSDKNELEEIVTVENGSDDGSTNTEESCNCSCCSCDTCANDSSGTSRNSASSNEKMAPNSEEDFQSKRAWGPEYTEKEPLRPPVYNPEDYAISLKKWGRKNNSGMQLPLYLSQSTGSIEKLSADFNFPDKGGQSSVSTKSSSSIKNSDEKQSKKERDFTLKMEKKDLKNKENIHRGMKNELNKDFKNPILALATQEGEMSLRQFSSVTELLGKLKVDLKLSFPSFVQEFVGDPVDGVTLLLELLRAVQLSQASQQQKRPPQIFRRALLDEHSCLVCLKHCLRCSDATRRLVSSSAGLFTLAVCIMSNVTQSRIIALELLTKACEIPGSGHKAVSEALSTLRLRFGEPVRFRFLVGMLNSAGTIELLAAAMKFINVFVETAPSIQQKVYIQAELEQAGFEAKTLRKTLPCNSESVKSELNKWEKIYLDVENLQTQVGEVNSLQEKIQLLEKRIEILQEEKGILQSLEQCLKERCSELEEEMSIKTNTTAKTPSNKPFNSYNVQQNNKRNAEKGESTPAEDEGISSSEQELSQDEDYVKSGVTYGNGQAASNGTDSRRQPNSGVKDSKNFKNVRASAKMKESNVDDGNEIVPNEEEETTIEEVIEELENIVNDAETEVYGNDEIRKDRELPRFSVATHQSNKSRIYGMSSQEKEAFEETEIIPSLLHPQPPRKAKSLVHIYFPRRDFDDHDLGKSEFFDEDTDTESSDSLLTATREKRSMINKSCHRSLDVTDSFGTFSSTNTRTLFIKQEDDYEESGLNVKMSYEERNIDEEEMKRKHGKPELPQYLKMDQMRSENFTSPIFFKDNKFGVESRKPVFQKDFIAERMTRESGQSVTYEKTTSFQGVQTYERSQGEGVYPKNRPCSKYPPTPVKRSQTFHLSTSDGDVLYKRPDMKPKPKMGVSGLDFQRNTDQKILKNDKYQSRLEYKKNFEIIKPEINDRYLKRAPKEPEKDYESHMGRSNLYRRGSFDGVFSMTETSVERRMQKPEMIMPKPRNTSPESFTECGERPSAKIRSKSLEKMDEGLDSLVDIVIATEDTVKPKPKPEIEQGKNIGPRTRRSLAESSLFVQPREKLTTTVTVEESPKPPKPAQRTSLTRHSSSSTPLHLPKEIKLAPVQPNPRQIVYNFGCKTAKSEDSVFSAAKRCPPDGSSNPTEFKTTNRESNDQNVIYSTPVKPLKLPNVCTETSYYTNNHGDQPVSPKPRNIQNLSNNQGKGKSSPTPKPNPTSKPNFLLGTYQSQASKNIPKPTSSVMNSINNFNNNTFLGKKPTTGNVNGKPYSGYSGSESNGSNGSGHRKSNNSLTDSPSGLY